MFLSTDLQRIVLIDFGSADDLTNPDIRKAAESKDPRRNMHRNFVGTAQYMAPECVRNKEITKAADIWSLGCILYQLHAGLLPFRGASDYLIFRRSTEGRYRHDIPVIPFDAQNLISRCLQPDPSSRPSIEDILKDNYLTDQSELIEQRP
jgi:3-phosphoinositide dependent protein kinase-1